jgi:hypothetical protein
LARYPLPIRRQAGSSRPSIQPLLPPFAAAERCPLTLSSPPLSLLLAFISYRERSLPTPRSAYRSERAPRQRTLPSTASRSSLPTPLATSSQTQSRTRTRSASTSSPIPTSSGSTTRTSRASRGTEASLKRRFTSDRENAFPVCSLPLCLFLLSSFVLFLHPSLSCSIS